MKVYVFSVIKTVISKASGDNQEQEDEEAGTIMARLAANYPGFDVCVRKFNFKDKPEGPDDWKEELDFKV